MPPSNEGTRLLDAPALLHALDYELNRALRYGRPFSVLRIVPHLLPDEVPSDTEINCVADCIAAQLRDVDRVGRLDNASFVALLPETDQAAAQIAAGRI